MRTVLIFAHECAPYNRPESTIGAQRPAQFAKWLPSFGWRAVVVCCDAGRRRSVRPADLPEGARETAEHFAKATSDRSVIIPTPSLVADGALDGLAQSFYTGGASIVPGARWLRKPLTLLKLFTGDYSQSWRPCAASAADEVSRLTTIDACLSEHGPDAAIYLAREFSRRLGVPWLADFRDPALQPLPAIARQLYRPWLRRQLGDASCTISVNEHWARLDERAFNRPSFCIPNGYDPDEFPRDALYPLGGPLHIVYLGNILRPYQRIEVFLDGLRMLAERYPNGREIARFTYVGGAKHEVEQLAEQRHLRDQVIAIQRVERTEALRIARSAHLMLILGAVAPPGDQWYSQGFVPGKLLEYLGMEKPILCVPNDNGLVESLLAETRAGVTRNSASEVASFLIEAHRALLGRGRLDYRPDQSAISRYSRREQAGQLAMILNRFVENRRSPATREQGLPAEGKCYVA